MLLDLIEVDNALDDLDYFIKQSKSQTYYKSNEHPSNTDVNYAGSRSNEFNAEDTSRIAKAILDKCFTTAVADKIGIDCQFQLRCYYHYLTENDTYNDSWIHSDPNDIYAGVIYLNDNKNDNGTIVYRNPISYLQMRKNRLVMYRSDYEHSARNGFGKDANDARLSIVFFIRGLRVTLVKND